MSWLASSIFTGVSDFLFGSSDYGEEKKRKKEKKRIFLDIDEVDESPSLATPPARVARARRDSETKSALS
jgi:hypothetical protein